MLTLSFLALAFAPVWWISFAAIAVIGLGFYMVHNTLQINATQMAPKARATAIGIFSSAIYLGQARASRPRRRSSTVMAPCRSSCSRRLLAALVLVVLGEAAQGEMTG